MVVVGQFLTFLMVGISQDDDVGDDGGCCGFLPLDG